MSSPRRNVRELAGALLVWGGVLALAVFAEAFFVRWSVLIHARDYSPVEFVVERVERQVKASRGASSWRWIAVGEVLGGTESIALRYDSRHLRHTEERLEAEYPRGRIMQVLHRPNAEWEPLFGPSLRVVSAELRPTPVMAAVTVASTAGALAAIVGGAAILFHARRTRNQTAGPPVPATTPSPSPTATRSHAPSVRIRAALVGGTVVPLHLALDLVYRPWALERQPIDLGLAGSFTQVTAVVGVSALMVLLESRALWRDRLNESLVVVAPTVGMLGYEMLQRWLPWATFDEADLAWTLVGAVAAWVVKRAVYDPVMRRDGERNA